MSFRVATSYRLPQYHEYMRSHGFDLTFIEMQRNDEDETIAKMYGFDAIAAGGEPFNARVLDALQEHLKIIVRHGIGYDRVDIDHAAGLGICCCNTPGAMSSGVAETALAMMLECTRGFYRRHQQMVNGIWDRGPITNQLEGATVGLVGFGNIAQRVAQYLQGFRCRLLAYDVHYNEAALETLGVEKASLDRIAAEADIVSVHVPLLPQTTHFIDAAFFAKMKPSAFLINTSRGGTVNEPDLIAALQAGTIAGAGLDVFWHEPLEPDSPLRRLDNVFLTPHVSTTTHPCFKAGFDGIMRALTEFQQGQVPAYCLNPSYVEHLRR